ncbi:hypothetical protein G6F37_012175 [Rhizopus arrhizus]|nr:hypothetical protein G6F38_011982 [Rhizopus arrhizus]KAG1145261.1 hypothetical protein G6F37_012175 [Rhizopus arrhizus]
MLPKVSQCTARFVYALSPPALHQFRRNLYHVHLHYRSFQMSTISFLFSHFIICKYLKTYSKYQLRFLAWARTYQVSCTAFSGSDLVNFLAYSRQEHQLQPSTLRTVRAAVVHFHDSPQELRAHPLVNKYLATITKRAPPKLIHKDTVDMSPSLAFAESIASRTTTDLGSLQKKLAFVLAMTTFLRPSDLARILYASCRVNRDDGCLLFQVVSPKETRNGRRIIKPFRVHPYPENVERCPVRCFLALRDHPAFVRRPLGSQLFVKSNNIHQHVAASTISTWLHRDFISLSTKEPKVNIRSLASSRTLNQGVSMEDIVTMGNWTRSTTFQNHYQRNHMAQVNFTTTALSSNDEEFFDAADTFMSLD